MSASHQSLLSALAAYACMLCMLCQCSAVTWPMVMSAVPGPGSQDWLDDCALTNLIDAAACCHHAQTSFTQ